MLKRISLLVVSSLTLSQGLFARASVSENSMQVNFSEANKLFKQRGDGASVIVKAAELYKNAAEKEGVSADQVVYAVSQYSRLALYTVMHPSVTQSQKENILNNCINLNYDRIRHTNSQKYHYYYTACIATRGKIASTFERIKYGIWLSNAQDKALEATTVNGEKVGGYEAGGILRVFAGVRGNIKAQALGLYNPEEAVKFAHAALQSEGGIYPPFEEFYTGADYYENYYYYAQAQLSLGLEKGILNTVRASQETAQNAVSEIKELEADELLSEERQPERSYYKAEMIKLGEAVNQCASTDDWRSCLRDSGY